jgi:hypothetical protein
LGTEYARDNDAGLDKTSSVSIVEPPSAEPTLQSPESIEQLLKVIDQVTQLIKDQAVDLRASKRLRRLLRDQQPLAGRRQDRSLPLHRDLDQVPTIIDDLAGKFVGALRDAADVQGRSARAPSGEEDRDQPIANLFVTLGLTDESDAWSLKYHAFQAAQAFAESPPIGTRARRFRNDRGEVIVAPGAEGPASAEAEDRSRQSGSERSRLRRLKKRGPALKLGNSVVGSASAAIPFVGGLAAEGYGEVKDHLEELGNLARAAGRGLTRPVHWVAGKIPGRAPAPEPVAGATA